MLLLATWQATRGSVYSEVGALTGVFMAGVASAAGRVIGHDGPGADPAVGWSPAAPSCPGVGHGRPDRAPLVLVPVLLVTGGVLTGAAFPGLGELASRASEPPRRRARLRRRRDRRRRRGTRHRHRRHPVDRDDGDGGRVGGVGDCGDSWGDEGLRGSRAWGLEGLKGLRGTRYQPIRSNTSSCR